ncbi:MAG: caspase family protein [Hyphomicrobiaceae bacterium]
MPVLRSALLCLLVLVAALPAVAQAPARHALLIGNQAYSREVGTLKNPANDVALIAGALEKIGFKRENIRRVTDADRVTILREIDAYGDRLAAAGADAIGFFYYSGHGVANERDQRNYLIPIEVKQLDSAVWYSGVPLDDIIAKLAAQAREASQFVLFDACRNLLNVPSRGSKGFVPVASRRGMLIGFSTDPGQTASDLGAGSGPYAAALAAELVKPGQDHLGLFQNVKEQVYRTTKVQVPWERNRLLSRVYLAGQAAVAAPPSASQAPPISVSRAEIAAFCREIATNPSAAIVGSLRDASKGTPMAGCAEARLAELKRQRVASAAPAPTPAARPAPATPRCDSVEVALGTGGHGVREAGLGPRASGTARPGPDGGGAGG